MNGGFQPDTIKPYQNDGRYHTDLWAEPMMRQGS